MSWIFSKKLMEACGNSPSSQEQGVESLADICSDGEPYAQLNVMPTPHKFWRNDKTMEFSRLSQFGLTLRLLTEQDGEAVLMSYLEGFPARTSVQQEKALELKESEVGCGSTCSELLAKYDHDSSSWKTLQCSLLEDLVSFSETWPRWGMTHDGASYRQQTAVLLTSENGYGLLSSEETWPTPTASMDKKARGNPLNNAMATMKRGFSLSLPERVAMRMWPTPQASDNRDRGNLSTPAIARRMEKGKQVMLSMCVSEENGQLNPTWVEWLMGWPIGWTDLKPLEMARFQEWQQQHGAPLGANE